MTGPDRSRSLRRVVELQRNFLRNPLPAGPGVCRTCRGPVGDNDTYCRPCLTHRRALGGSVADLVVPISYAIRGEQHAHNLRMYKAQHPDSGRAQVDLLALTYCFLAGHARCLFGADTRPSAVALIPSTRGRPGAHPLCRIAAGLLSLPSAELIPNKAISADCRDARRDRFTLKPTPNARHKGAVLVLDDTWTTGSRVQSASYTLKQAGYAPVTALVLGRWLNPGWHETPRLLKRLGSPPFRLDDCAAHADDTPVLFDP